MMTNIIGVASEDWQRTKSEGRHSLSWELETRGEGQQELPRHPSRDKTQVASPQGIQKIPWRPRSAGMTAQTVALGMRGEERTPGLQHARALRRPPDPALGILVEP